MGDCTSGNCLHHLVGFIRTSGQADDLKLHIQIICGVKNSSSMKPANKLLATGPVKDYLVAFVLNVARSLSAVCASRW